MRIREKAEQIKMRFMINDQYVFLVRPPYEEDQKFGKCQAFNLDECTK